MHPYLEADINMQAVRPPHGRTPTHPLQRRGFTLIEVMIVVAIIGILSAIAMPLYRQYIDNARRAEARALLMENAQYMQRFYTANNGNFAKTLDNRDPVLPNTANNFYDFRIVPADLTATTFTLEAKPKGTMENDKCGTLGVTNTGARKSSKLTAAECWK